MQLREPKPRDNPPFYDTQPSGCTALWGIIYSDPLVGRMVIVIMFLILVALWGEVILTALRTL